MALNRRLVRVALVGLVVAGAFGCELMTAVDRDKIPEETAGTGGGSAGTGGKDGGAGTGGTAKGGAGGEDGGTGGLAGSGGVAGTGGIAGSSGTGGVTPECSTPADCDPVANECLEATCNGGKCGTTNKAAGTSVTTQVAGDCKKQQCDGKGAIETVNDNADVPVDNNPCTQDKCDNGTPSNPNGPADVDCGTGLKCDANGQCTGCAGDATKCPGADTDCENRTCSDQGVCGFNFTAAGTATTDQVAGDCKQKQCDGAGKIVEVEFESDATPDNNECTQDICLNGTATHPNKSAGAVCTTGGSVCDGAGNCVECTLPIHCTGTTVTACEDRTCEANVCGKKPKAAGTALPAAQQVKGDCKVKQCNGNGESTDVTDDTDLPVDTKECTVDTCTNGEPSNPPKTTGTACGSGGTLKCDANGECVGCVTADDCAGTNDDCKTKTCTSGTCGFDYAADGKVVTAQTAGDCKEAQCDGAGAIKQVAKADDLPTDNNQCTNQACNGTSPEFPYVQAGTACTQDNGKYCDGAGKCVACTQDSHCGTNDDCNTYTCSAQGTCSVAYAAEGKNLTNQTAGDCHVKQCGANGTVVDNVDTTDTKTDNNDCTTDTCSAQGALVYTPVAQGDPCGTNGKCDATGHCVGCNTEADCPTGNLCQQRICDSNKICGFTNINEDQKVGSQTLGDCHSNVCKAGVITTVVDDTDVNIDGLDCTQDLCTSGTPSNPPVALPATCNDNGGAVCNTLGQCVQCVDTTTCGGAGTFCQPTVCKSDYTCGTTNTAIGTPLPVADQTAGDCHTRACDGAGAIANNIDNSDLPAADGTLCTQAACNAGAPEQQPVAEHTTCSDNGGKVCNATGVCVACTLAADCAGGTECKPATCTSNACGTENAAINTVCETTKFCDGAGACVQCNLDSQCTGGSNGTCNTTTHVCSYASCTDNTKNGLETDIDCGGGTCNPCAVTRSCISASDCQSGVCTGNVCQAPLAASTTPADAATGIAVNTSIGVTFTAAMAPATLTAQTADGACTGSIQVSSDDFATCLGMGGKVMSNSDKTVTFTPVAMLSQGTTYKIRVTTAATDFFTNPVAAYTSTTGFATVAPAPLGPQVVISQVYGGGGNTNAQYKNDFVELHNRGITTVNLTGWSLQWTSQAGTWTDSGSLTALSGSIAPGGYYLIKLAAGSGGNGADLPAADATGTSAVGAGSFKFALVSNTTPLTTACPTGGAIVDFVSAGSACFEGTATAPAPSNSTAILRAAAGCVDTNNNGADFSTGVPTPRNSASANNLACNLSANETGNTVELDYCNIQFPTSITINAGEATPMIYGQVNESGVTGPNPLPATLVAQVGYGLATVNPETQSGWNWFDMTQNAGFTTDPNDEFQGAFTPAAAGTYKYGVRMSLDSGVHWTYCDLNGAGSNANLVFETSQLPTLTVQ